jgi:hypothetical protein
MRAVLLALIAAFAFPASAAADAPAKPAIETPADLDAWLAHADPAGSPFDRLSPQARARFFDDFRKGYFLVPDDLDAELTHDESLAILALFGIDEVPSAMTPRVSHLAIGATETPALTASFAAFDTTRRAGSPEAALAEYRRVFALRQNEAAVRALSNGDLALLLRAALEMSRDYASASDDARLDLAEAERRGVDAPTWVREIHHELVKRRDFADAETFRAAHPDARLPALPPLRDARSGNGPSVLEISASGDELIRRTVSVDEPAQVIVVAGCHFSKDAARAIEADPVLRTLFSRHVTWVTPSEYDPADPALVVWNREHPVAAMSTAWREREWPIAFEAMPTFYFLEHGKVEATVTGWQRDKVEAAFRQIGLAR